MTIYVSNTEPRALNTPPRKRSLLVQVTARNAAPWHPLSMSEVRAWAVGRTPGSSQQSLNARGMKSLRVTPASKRYQGRGLEIDDL